ncbi:hypothetical protein [Streptomyces sp. NPDC127084]|uniref:hypothetical protein n=1 Tax=Streptomyces sp. NPDC127084 TaxID=3347133 RepID=UPI00365823F4
MSEWPPAEPDAGVDEDEPGESPVERGEELVDVESGDEPVDEEPVDEPDEAESPPLPAEPEAARVLLPVLSPPDTPASDGPS